MNASRNREDVAAEQDTAGLLSSVFEVDGESAKGPNVTFHNISYDVNVTTGFCRSELKSILHNVSGVFKPGTMNAILGPTGSGKSSLLDILAARKDPKGLTGNVLIDGHFQPVDFRMMSGYVVQDDVVMGTLSVRENLQFSADLRLPSHVSAEERRENVDRVISELGLEKCADSRCGDEFTRGISGGERKRVNVGMELITAPGVLFLDEPTTGLDASTANSVMLLLKKLALQGSTIIYSIHQPRFSIFKLCDTIMLLGNGGVIYHGPALEGVDFFRTLGYEMEKHENPADFYLDIVNGDVEPPLSVQHELEHIEQENSPRNIDANINTRLNAILVERFKSSVWYRRTAQELQPFINTLQQDVDLINAPFQFPGLTYHTGPFIQFAVVSGRNLKNFLRNPRTGVMQLLTTIIFAVITGGIYFHLANDCISGIQNRVGAFFFVVMNQIFSNLSAIDLFINERTVFMHENISGYYRVSSYYFAKLFCDVLPNRTLPVIFYATITYWMVGLFASWDTFLIFVLILILTTWAASFVAFVASATTRTAAIANLICALIYVFMMVFSGLLINLDQIGKHLQWAQYLSIFHYSMTALQINEFKHLNFTEKMPYPGIDCVQVYLDKQGISYKADWDLWKQLVALAGMTLGLIIITYVQLRRMKKLK